jgi:thiol:disulfide interchange protein
MRKTLLGIGCAAALLAGCEIGVEQPAPAGAKVEQRSTASPSAAGQLQFIDGYRQGFAESTRRNKPMMLFFTASWCEYCHQMAEEALAHPQVVRLGEQFVCVRIDADAEPEVCRQFQISGYPTIQFLSPRGFPLERVVGKQPGHQVLMAMQTALQQVARRSGPAEAERH